MKQSLLLALVVTMACGSAMAQSKSAASASKAPGAAAGMKPGLWEITTVNETAGSATKRTVTARTCYAAEDVASAQRILPQQREFGMKCETRDAKQQGAEVRWRVACTGKDGSMTGLGKMNLASESFTGSADLERKPSGAKPAKVAQTVTGKWLGACK